MYRMLSVMLSLSVASGPWRVPSAREAAPDRAGGAATRLRPPAGVAKPPRAGGRNGRRSGPWASHPHDRHAASARARGTWRAAADRRLPPGKVVRFVML